MESFVYDISPVWCFAAIITGLLLFSLRERLRGNLACFRTQESHPAWYLLPMGLLSLRSTIILDRTSGDSSGACSRRARWVRKNKREGARVSTEVVGAYIAQREGGMEGATMIFTVPQRR